MSHLLSISHPPIKLVPLSNNSQMVRLTRSATFSYISNDVPERSLSNDASTMIHHQLHKSSIQPKAVSFIPINPFALWHYLGCGQTFVTFTIHFSKLGTGPNTMLNLHTFSVRRQAENRLFIGFTLTTPLPMRTPLSVVKLQYYLKSRTLVLHSIFWREVSRSFIMNIRYLEAYPCTGQLWSADSRSHVIYLVIAMLSIDA
jgi:hypothetical protein